MFNSWHQFFSSRQKRYSEPAKHTAHRCSRKALVRSHPTINPFCQNVSSLLIWISAKLNRARLCFNASSGFFLGILPQRPTSFRYCPCRHKQIETNIGQGILGEQLRSQQDSHRLVEFDIYLIFRVCLYF